MANRTQMKKYTKVFDLWINLTRYYSQLKQTRRGCQEWQGAKHRQGYGMVSGIRVSDNKRIMTVAHRVAMRIKLNRELGPTDDVQHACGNPACCNPDHLVLKLSMQERIELEQRARQNESTTLTV